MYLGGIFLFCMWVFDHHSSVEQCVNLEDFLVISISSQLDIEQWLSTMIRFYINHTRAQVSKFGQGVCNIG